MDFLLALDVLLGLSLIYLVFALAVTSINEFIAAALSSRARWLRRGIASLLSVDPRSLDTERADGVLDSPFLSHLGTRGVWKTFRVSYVSAWQLTQGVLSQVQGFKEDAFARVGDIRALAEQLPANAPMRSALIDLCARANGDLAKFQLMLDDWFKTFEDQLTAWYRQKTQYVLVGISFFVVLTMNVDTIDLARQLSADPRVRAQLVEQAMKVADAADLAALLDTAGRDRARKEHEEALKRRDEAEKGFRSACQAPEVEVASARACADATGRQDEARREEVAKRAALAAEQKALDSRVKERADALSASGLMIGWKGGEFAQALAGGNWLAKLVGLLLSGFAIALGAPFWFNVLKSVASVRSVGANVKEKADSAG